MDKGLRDSTLNRIYQDLITAEMRATELVRILSSLSNNLRRLGSILRKLDKEN